MSLEARSEKQQRLESAPGGAGGSGARPAKSPWPSGMAAAGARELPTPLHYAQEMPLGKGYVSPPTSSGSQVSPGQAYTPSVYQVNEAERYQKWVAAPQGQEPHELPASN